MFRLARFAIGRPRLALAVWGSAIGLLAVVGLGVEDRLHRSNLDVPGTASDEAASLQREAFGDRATLIVLLTGPAREIDRQGRALMAELGRRPRMAAIGPWTPGTGRALRPRPTQALVLLRSDLPFEEASRDAVPQVRSAIDRATSPPVEARLSGYPVIAAGIHNSSVTALSDAEKLAAPLLIVVLLVIFRSVVAASLPLIVGFATIAAAGGVLSIVNRLTAIDVVALNLASMMGLALGVDYALLLVSRFREELAAGRDRIEAAAVAVERAGRTIVFAGLALSAAMTTAVIVAPGALLSSSTFGVVVAAALSMIAALVALPAALVLLGERINRWSLGRSRTGDSRFGAMALRALRRPALAGALVLGLVVAMAAPAMALQTGPPDPRVLPSSSRERVDFEAIRDALGAGWAAPFEIVVTAPDGTVTDPSRLAALDRWQARAARLPGVVAVMGPAEIARRTRTLEHVPAQLARADDELRRGVSAQRRLQRGLHRAGSGVDQLRTGLARATEGAGLLGRGGDGAAAGAGRLQSGIAEAREGARGLRAGLEDATAGAAAVSAGADRARQGGLRLEHGLASARRAVAAGRPGVHDLATGLQRGSSDLLSLREPAATAERELARALRLLDGMLPTSKIDPAYRRLYEAVATASGAVSGRHPRTGGRVASGYDGLDAALAEAHAGMSRAADGAERIAGQLARLERALARLEEGAARLGAGIARLRDGVRRLEEGLGRLGEGGSDLLAGLARLERGAGVVASGTSRLERGAGRLEGELAGGVGSTRALRSGFDRLERGVQGASVRTRDLGRRLGDPEQLAGVVDSGFFVLAALDSAGTDERRSAGFAVNVDRGGSAAQLVVVGDGDVTRSGNPLRGRLERELDRLESETGMVGRVGGPAALLQDFDSATAERFWLLVVALCGVTYLILVPVLRSVLLPFLAVVLNVLTVGAAFGVLVVLFQGDALLGGPGFLDAIMVGGIFSVVFGLSIDYEVFLLARMREGWELTGTTDGAIAYGLRRTAGVVTGAALIMTGVFLSFAVTDIASLRQLGIGMTVAVLLDATLVRLVLLPAAIRLFGDASWWSPSWLAGSRRIPPAATAKGANAE